MADFWPLFSDDVVTDDDDDGQPNARTSNIATDDAFGDHHGGAVGSFDDELVRGCEYSLRFQTFWFGARGCEGRDRVRRARAGASRGVFSLRTDPGEWMNDGTSDARCEIDSISL